MRRMIGTLMAAIPFVAVFCLIGNDLGWLQALAIYALSTFASIWIVAAVILVSGD